MTKAEQEKVEGVPTSLSSMIALALRRWRLVAAATVVVLTLTVFALMGQRKIYAASATVKIDPTAVRPLGRSVEIPEARGRYYWENKEYFATQNKLMASRAVCEEVVTLLELHHDTAFIHNLSPGETAKPDKKVGKQPSVSDVAKVLKNRLTVSPQKDTHLVVLSLEDADPKRASRVLATLVETYIRRNLESSVSLIGDASEWLQDEQRKLKKELESSEMALHEYKKNKRLLSASLTDQSNMLRAEMENINRALTDARTRREKLAAKAAQLALVDQAEPTHLPEADLLKNATLTKLQASFAEAQSDTLSLKRAGRGENHPEVLRATARMSSSRTALSAAITNVKDAAQRDLAAANQEIAGLQRLYDQAEKRAMDLNLLEIEYKRLQRANGNTERLYSLVIERSKESELTQRMRFNNVSVVDSPLVPQVPVKPRKVLFLGVGLLLGLAGGLALALAREQFDRRLTSKTHLEAKLGLPCLGVIPEFDGLSIEKSANPRRGSKSRRVQDNGTAPLTYLHESPSSKAAEAVRALRTNLLLSSPDRPYGKLLVTSAGPSEGKSTVATSLAIALAQSEKSVVLVDADLRRPRISPAFQKDQNLSGVSSAVLKLDQLMSCLVTSPVPNMSVLPAGALPPNPAELLHSANFEKVVERLAKNFDYVVIDSPPLNPVTDAAILSRLVDATLLVVRAGKTRDDHALNALRSLKDVQANAVGVVLNGVKKNMDGYGYGYGYGAYTSKPSSASPS